MSKYRIAALCLALIMGPLGGCAAVGDGSRDVEILTQTPTRPFHVITTVNFGGSVSEHISNQKGLESLRALATKSGADAIVGVTRETTFGDKVLASATYGSPEWSKPTTVQPEKGTGLTISEYLKALSVVYRAQAIKYE